MNEFDTYKKQIDYQSAAQSQLQDEADLGQTRLVAPQMKEQIAEAQAAVIAQTNPALALQIILNGFRGMIEQKDLQGNVEFKQIGLPIMNEQGIGKISTMLIPFINDPVRFGDIRQQEVRDLSLQIADDITVEIGLNWREYGIKNPSSRDVIIDALVTLIFITLTRSEGGGEKQFLSKVIVESLGGTAGKKKDSTWEKMKSQFKW